MADINLTAGKVKRVPLHKRRFGRNFAIERADAFRPRMEIKEWGEMFSCTREQQFMLFCDLFVYDAGATYFSVDLARWPADWWQAVKERFAPTWFLNRWPVKWETKEVKHTFEVKAVLPRVVKEEEYYYLYEFDGQPVMPGDKDEAK